VFVLGVQCPHQEDTEGKHTKEIGPEEKGLLHPRKAGELKNCPAQGKRKVVSVAITRG